MGSRHHLAAVPTLIGLAALLSAADGAPVTKTVKLSAAPVVPTAVMTSTVVAGANRNGFWSMMVSKNGIIQPAQGATFGKDQSEQVVSLGGQGFTFTVNRDTQAFAVKGDKGAASPLKGQGDGLTPLAVPLASKRKLALAFPIAKAAKGESFIGMRSAAAAKGTLDGEAIQFIDDNLDGSLNQADGFTIGTSPCYAPIAKRIATKKGVYTLDELADDGSKATFTPEAGDAVLVASKFTGESAGHAVIASEDGSLMTVLTGADAVKLPPGAYKLQYGTVYAATGKVMAVIVPGELAAFTVESAGADAKDAKKKQVLAYGGPFRLGFTARIDNGKLAVTPDITLNGAGGERYIDYRWQGPPTVYVNGKQNGSMGFG